MKSKILLSIFALVIFPIGAQALVVDTGANVQVDAVGVGTTIDANASLTSSTSESADQNQILMTTSDESSVMSSVDVTSDAKLSLFTESITTANTNVEKVSIGSDNKITVTYNYKVKLFGFIPVTMRSETVVSSDTEGDVQAVTTLPWWKVLVAGGSDISDDVDAALQSSTSIKNYVAAKADASANVKAQAAEVIVATLNAKAGVALLAQ